VIFVYIEDFIRALGAKSSYFLPSLLVITNIDRVRVIRKPCNWMYTVLDNDVNKSNL